jgi:hypothetical protein
VGQAGLGYQTGALGLTATGAGGAADVLHEHVTEGADDGQQQADREEQEAAGAVTVGVHRTPRRRRRVQVAVSPAGSPRVSTTSTSRVRRLPVAMRVTTRLTTLSAMTRSV